MHKFRLTAPLPAVQTETVFSEGVRSMICCNSSIEFGESAPLGSKLEFGKIEPDDPPMNAIPYMLF